MAWLLFIIVVLLIVLFLMIYAVVIRRMIRNKPWAKPFFDAIEPYELFLFKKSETLLWSRLLMFLGGFQFLLENVAVFNTPEIIELLPEHWAKWAPLAFMAIGLISEMMRRDTTKPLDLVALPDNVPEEVKEKVDQAEVAKEEAIVAVKEEVKP